MVRHGTGGDDSGALTLKLGTTEVLDDILPIRGVLIATQVGLQATTQDLEGGTLADTVGSDQTEDLARAGHRQTVKLEAVGSIAMCDLALEVRGQVDDGDRIEGALLRADTTSNAE
jgi:hypothetical protein